MQSNVMNRKRRGFTLLELIVVVAVIAVLAAITVGAVKYVGQKGDQMTAVGDLEKISNELEEYKSQYGFYPPDAPVVPLDPWGDGYIYYPILADGTVVSNQLPMASAPVGYRLFSYGGDKKDATRRIFSNR